MKLTLDHTQRLNLHALMGAQRASLDDLRMLWRLQDRIELSDEEKASIRYRVEQINGMQQIQWDISKARAPKDYEFEEAEFARLSKIVREWQPGFLIGADRQWLETLMAQLETTNGTK